MRRAEEAPLIADLYRQEGEDGRRALLLEMQRVVLSKLAKTAGQTAPDPLDRNALADLRFRLKGVRLSSGERAALDASVALEGLLAAGPLPPEGFAKVAAVWTRLDPPAGRRKTGRGKSAAKAVVMQTRANHPNASAKEIIRLIEKASGWPLGATPPTQGTVGNWLSLSRKSGRE